MMLTPPPTEAMPRVAGRCPACGAAQLRLDHDGEITCAHLGCTMPDAVDQILNDPHIADHIVRLGTREYTIRHPLVERLEMGIEECELHLWLQHQSGPPAEPGQYLATRPQAPGPAEAWHLERLPYA